LEKADIIHVNTRYYNWCSHGKNLQTRKILYDTSGANIIDGSSGMAVVGHVPKHNLFTNKNEKCYV